MNLTLFGQLASFALFSYLVYRFLWDPITNMLEERRKRVADGLAAAERGQREQELAEKHAREVLLEAKEQANEIIANAQRRADEIVEGAKDDARIEGERIVSAARSEVDQQINLAREGLRREVVALAIEGAEQVLKRKIDAKTNSEALEKLAAQL
ncbi:F0F1 ATP synthase subunit B [Nitrococcus mobilis]|uniref:ATP synthase subunit b n=1 Tax=Nitrococcus mobilis Nb-231 TaxID=314278 RepID=A4BNZ8_9GAMM|nr:F0F1 ATP synthase subunit B [Nitrococcus mobilis]EAR22947.1 ATP synthase F0, subunit B [Nitrococcus mobilis Nb-231]